MEAQQEFDYEGFRQSKFQTQREKNLKELEDHIRNDQLTDDEIYKLENRFILYRTIYVRMDAKMNTFEKYLEACKTNPLLWYGVEKDPKRQGLDEKFQIEKFNEIHGRNIQKLPGTGTRALCFDKQSRIVQPKGLNFEIGERSKTFDAIEKWNGRTIYYTIKYCKQTGGEQTTKLKEPTDFIQFVEEYCRINPSTTIDFGMILSGEFAKKYYEIISKSGVESARLKLYYV